jgi:hypothetical protein
MADVLIAILLLLVVVGLVSSPWRARRRHRLAESGELTAARGELLEAAAARDAKYREIRDAELDHQTGKLSDTDFATVDAALRAEAVALLRRLDRAQARVEKLAARELERSVAPTPEQPADDARAVAQTHTDRS